MGPPGRIVTIKRSGLDGPHFPLSLSSCLFGRGVECDIRIQLPVVSRQHCSIQVREQEATLFNFSTVNPTRLNGAVLAEPAQLRHGDIITIVDRSFRYEKENPPSGSQSAASPGPRGQGHKQVPQRRASGAARSDVGAGDSTDAPGDTVPASPEVAVKSVPAAAPGQGAEGHAGGKALTPVGTSEPAGAPLTTPGPQNHGRNASPFQSLYELMKEDLDARAEKENAPGSGRTPGPHGRPHTPQGNARPLEPRRKSGRGSPTPMGPVCGDQGGGEGRPSSPGRPCAGTPKAKSPAQSPQHSSSRKRREKGSGGLPGAAPVSRAPQEGPPAEDGPLAPQPPSHAGATDPVGGSPPELRPTKRGRSLPQSAGLWVQSPAVLAPLLVQEEREQQDEAGSGSGPLCEPEGLPLKRRRVSFGGRLRPELFDENLPPNTPLKRGETPARRRSLAAHTPAVLKKIIKELPPAEDEAAPAQATAPAPEEQRRRSVRAAPGPEDKDKDKDGAAPRRAPRKSGQHGLLRLIYSRRRSGASEANLMVARSWADVVKLGAKQMQQSRAARQPAPRREPGRKQRRPPTPKKPATPVPGGLSTGHANSPRTITVGRAQLPRACAPPRAPSLLGHLACRKPDFSEDLSGLTELFKTPVREKPPRKSSHLAERPGPEASPRKSPKGPSSGASPGPQRAAEETASPALRRQSGSSNKGAVKTSRGGKSTAGAQEPERDARESRLPSSAGKSVQAEDSSRKMPTPRPSRRTSELRPEAADLVGQEESPDMEATKEQADTPSLPRGHEPREAGDDKADMPSTALRAGPGGTPGTGSRLRTPSRKEDRPLGLAGSPHTPGAPTPTLTDDDKQMTLVQETPKQHLQPTGGVTGSRRRPRAPRAKTPALEDLEGVRQLFQTPGHATEPGTDQASEAPSTAPKPEPVLTPVSTSRRLKTPSRKGDKTPVLTGSPHAPGAPTDSRETPKQKLKLEPAENIPGSRRPPRTPRRQAPALEDLEGVRQLFQTPGHATEPGTDQANEAPSTAPKTEPVLTPVSTSRRLKAPSRKGDKTPALTGSPHAPGAPTDSRETPKQKLKLEPAENVPGSRRPPRTPRRQAPALEDLEGVRQLFQTPGHTTEPGTDQASEAPSTAPKPEPVLTPVSTSRRLKTPSRKGDKTPALTGSPHATEAPMSPLTDDDKQMTLVQETPKQHLQPTGGVTGSRRRPRAPKAKTPALENMEGVRQLFQTPGHATEPGTDQASEAPSTAPKPEPVLTPVSTSRRLKTPSRKGDKTPVLTGSPHAPGAPTDSRETPKQKLKLEPAENVPGSRRPPRTPRRQAPALEDLEGVRQLFQTPGHATEPGTDQASEAPSTAPKTEPVLTPVSTSRRLKTPSRKGDKTPVLTGSPHAPGAPTDSRETPKQKLKLEAAENVPGSRRPPRTPRRQAPALEDLEGVRQLFQTPGHTTEPGTDQASEAPSTAPKPEPVLTPVSTSRRLKTPSRKGDKTPALTGSPHAPEAPMSPLTDDDKQMTLVQETPKQHLQPTGGVTGSRRRPRTPRAKTPALEDLEGVRQLFQTPGHTTEPGTDQASEAPKADPADTPVSTQLKTPSQKGNKTPALTGSPHTPGAPTDSRETPKQKLEPAENVPGSRRPPRTPRRQAPALEDLEGVRQLFQTPGQDAELVTDHLCQLSQTQPVDLSLSKRRPHTHMGKAGAGAGEPEPGVTPEDTPLLKGAPEQKQKSGSQGTNLRRQPRAPREKAPALEDLSGLSELFRTPEHTQEPLEVEEPPERPYPFSTPVSGRRRLQTPLGSVTERMELSAFQSSTGTPRDTAVTGPAGDGDGTRLLQGTPNRGLEPTGHVSRSRRRSQVPLAKALPQEDLNGLPELFQTPQQAREPQMHELTTASSTTPKPKPDLSPVSTTRRLKTPSRKQDRPLGLAGSPHTPGAPMSPLTDDDKQMTLVQETPKQHLQPTGGVTGSRRPRAPRAKTPALEDLEGVRQLFQTPGHATEPGTDQASEAPSTAPKPEPVLTPVSTSRRLKAPSRKGDKTPALTGSPHAPGAPTDSRETPKQKLKLEPAENVPGSRRPPRTPRRQAPALEDLEGVRQLFLTPGHTTEPGTDQASEAPSTAPKPEPVLTPVSTSRRLKTPSRKGDKTPALTGSPHTPGAPTDSRETPKQKLEPAENVPGSRRLPRTPRRQAPALEDLEGVRQLFQTPGQDAELVTDHLCQLSQTQPVDLSLSKRRPHTPLGKAGAGAGEPESGVTPEDTPLLKGAPEQKRKSRSQGTNLRRQPRAPREKAPALEDLSGLSELFRTPERTQEPLASVKTKTPYKPPKAGRAITPASAKGHSRTPVPKTEVEAVTTAPGALAAIVPMGEEPAGDHGSIEPLEDTPKKPRLSESTGRRQGQPQTPEAEARLLENMAGSRGLPQTPEHGGQLPTSGRASPVPCRSPEPREPASKRRRAQSPAGEGHVEPAGPAGGGKPPGRGTSPRVLRAAARQQKAGPAGNGRGSRKQPRAATQKPAPSEGLAGSGEPPPSPAPTAEPVAAIRTCRVPRRPQEVEPAAPTSRARRPRAPVRKGEAEELPPAPSRPPIRAGRAAPAGKGTSIPPPKEAAEQPEEQARGSRRQRRALEEQPREAPPAPEQPQEPVAEDAASRPEPTSRARRTRAPVGKRGAEEAPPALRRPPIRTRRATPAPTEVTVDGLQSLRESAKQDMSSGENIPGSRRPLRTAQKKAQLLGDVAEGTEPCPASSRSQGPEGPRTDADMPIKSSEPEPATPTSRARRPRAPAGKAGEELPPALSRPPIRAGRATPAPTTPVADGHQVLEESAKQDMSSGENVPGSRKPLRTAQKMVQFLGDVAEGTEPCPASPSPEGPRTDADMPSKSSEPEPAAPTSRARRPRAPAGKAGEALPPALSRPPIRAGRAAPAGEGTSIPPPKEAAEQKVEPEEQARGSRRRRRALEEQPREAPPAPEQPQEPVAEDAASRPEPTSRARRTRAPVGKRGAEEAPPALRRPPIRAGRGTCAHREPEGVGAVPPSLEETPEQKADPAESAAGSRRQLRATKASARTQGVTDPTGFPADSEEPIQTSRRGPRLLKAESRVGLEGPGVTVTAQSNSRAALPPPRGRAPAGCPPAVKRLRSGTPPQGAESDGPAQKRRRTPSESGPLEPPDSRAGKRGQRALPRSVEPTADLQAPAQARPLRARRPQQAATEAAQPTFLAWAGEAVGRAVKGTERQAPEASGVEEPAHTEAGAGAGDAGSRARPRAGRQNRRPLPTLAEEDTRQQSHDETAKEAKPRLGGSRARKPAAPPAGDAEDSGPQPRAARGPRRRAPETRQDEDPASTKKVRTRRRQS
ncbi:proliferation marker protein Ki-67 isoform X2 [Erinaceus europaeus]|uniref:Proliferation marker protein Ki-67 isoform X2 n=1 Tax=Erinaceus europaeus TaxID=9365 RepID=A0ABM3VRS5_ERIEU|nr:proliferation marker protein Ki-67 isoform X2 [Erinaceus europaeus]